jgi:hypothetical protein
LRRVDGWLLTSQERLLATPGLLVVDLGFGASAFTTLELADRLRQRGADACVVGLDLDPARVAEAQPQARSGVRFAVGGFELAGLRPHVVRALNVLRQYDEEEVPTAWARMTVQLAPQGFVIEGTCDEAGRLGSWVVLDRQGPQTLTLAVDLRRPPSAVAARLPKALIHHNVPGQPIHRLLTDLDSRWDARSGLTAFGARQRFAAAAADLRATGWPVQREPKQWRRGLLTCSWEAVRPAAR